MPFDVTVMYHAPHFILTTNDGVIYKPMCSYVGRISHSWNWMPLHVAWGVKRQVENATGDAVEIAIQAGSDDRCYVIVLAVVLKHVIY